VLARANVIPSEHHQRFASSLESQTRFLERNLEWDLRGNHLFENLRTLILAGATFSGQPSDRRLEQGIRLFRQQLEEQLTPEGEHFERSPMYHAQMLLAVLDVRDATERLQPEFAAECRAAADRMARFLKSILHPDGQVPLLSDSALEETPDPGLLLEATNITPHDQQDAGAPQQVGAGNNSYWVWRDGDDFLLFDRGPVGADDLPAHAHNDLLTIEASSGGERFIVDSGVFDYNDAEMRVWCRSTAAHNVMQVDGAEQCDLWSRFRMGRRGHPTGSAGGCDDEFRWAAASHDAYSTIGIPQVGRWIACRPGGPWILADWADGTGDHAFCVRLHFAPGVTIAQQADREATLVLQNRSLKLRLLAAGRISQETGWYCPDFGVRIESPVIRFDVQAVGPTMIVYTLSSEDSTGDVTVESRDGGDVAVVWQSEKQRQEWAPRNLLPNSRTNRP